MLTQDNQLPNSLLTTADIPNSPATKPVKVSEEPAVVSSKAEEPVDEDDLDDLDDLLDDFADEVLNKPPGSAIGQADESATAASVTGTGAAPGATGNPFNPIDNELSSTNMEDLIKDLKIDDPETQKQFEELVKQFDETNKKDAAANPQNFDDVMKDTMERLKKSGKNIDEQIKNDQSSSNPEDMLTQILAGMGGAGEGGDLDMSKLLVDMLEQLSSKEVLYEPIKDLNTKFPDYLKENKEKISETDYNNYTKQYDITVEILSIFDAPGYDDSDKIKREQVNTLLESLQELGQPPTELVGEAGELPGFGAASQAGGLPGMDFNEKDLPKDFEKDLEEQCKQT